MKKTQILMFLFVMMTGVIIAGPTMKGATGLITMPTAEILQYKEYNMAADYQINMDNSDDSTYYYKMNVGALENAELGFVGGTEPDEGVFLNFKWNLSADSGRFPLKMAIGFENLTSKKQSDFYLVASKKMQADLGLHGGFKALFEDDIDVSLMMGADYTYNEIIGFAADMTSKKDSVYTVNAGAIFKLFNQEDIDDLHARVSIENILRNSGLPSYLNIGLAYTHML